LSSIEITTQRSKFNKINLVSNALINKKNKKIIPVALSDLGITSSGVENKQIKIIHFTLPLVNTALNILVKKNVNYL